MDTSHTAPPSYAHYWLVALVLLAGLGVTWYAAEIAVKGYHQQAERFHTQQHRILDNLVRERVRTLMESARWVVITSQVEPGALRQTASAFANSHPGVVSTGLVENANNGIEIRWEQPSALHRQDQHLSALVTHVSTNLDNSNNGEDVQVTPRVPTQDEPTSTELMGIFLHMDDNRWLTLVIDPDLWLKSFLAPQESPLSVIEIHDVDQHRKDPLYVERQGDIDQPSDARFSEIAVGNRQWMLSTRADANLYEVQRERAWDTVWLTGLVVTTLFAMTCFWLCRRIFQVEKQRADLGEHMEDTGQQLENIQVEKSILRQALNDSEQRSRDLVELCGGIVAELDERGRVGFISEGIAELLGHAPADLIGTPFPDLIPEHLHQRFEETLDTVRREPQIHRSDLELQNSRNDLVPATLRIRALHDAVYGCIGYRLSVQVNHS